MADPIANTRLTVFESRNLIYRNVSAYLLTVIFTFFDSLLLSVVFMVMVQEPFLIPVTFPEALIFAIFLLLEVYFKAFFVELDGETEA